MSEIIEIKVSDEHHGKRLDAVLGAMITDYSRSTLRTLIDEGKVTVADQTVTKASLKVNAGQNITVEIPEPENLEAQPQDLPLDIVYQDDDLIVINKPINFVVHPGSGIKGGTVMNAMLYHFPQTASLPRAGIVHRLDKDTSGLMVIALTAAARHHLMKAIAKHEVVREYEAIVDGEITSGGTIDAPIGRDPNNRTKMAVLFDKGREAVTHYRVMEHFRSYTRIKLRLETGRTHQIRVHMAYQHHPLLGDPQYGMRRLRHLAGADPKLDLAIGQFRHQALHASHIEFVHPISGEMLQFDAPLPEDMTNLIKLLREDFQAQGFAQ